MCLISGRVLRHHGCWSQRRAGRGAPDAWFVVWLQALDARTSARASESPAARVFGSFGADLAPNQEVRTRIRIRISAREQTA